MKKSQWIAETAVMLALLVVLQWVTKPLGQIVTGSCVNTVLAVSALLSCLSSSMTVALLSPVFAYFLGIAPQLITVPVIMAGNAMFVYLLSKLYGNGKVLGRNIATWLFAAAGKFVVLFFLVVRVICDLASSKLLDMGLIDESMLNSLPGVFALPQLLTALIGGGLAMLIVPLLKKALHRG